MNTKRINHRVWSLRSILLLACWLGFSFYGYCQGFGDQSFGNAEPTIDPQLFYQDGLILFKFDLDQNLHITDLKNNFFKIELVKNDFLEIREVRFPPGVPFQDETVFNGNFAVKVYVRSLKAITVPVKVKFKVSYQICREKPIEVCFPPEEKEREITISQTFAEANIEAPSAPAGSKLEDLSAGSSAAASKPKGGNWALLLAISLLLLGVSVFAGLSLSFDADDIKGKFLYAFLISILLAGAFLFLKALDIKYFPLNYSRTPGYTVEPNWIHSLEEGKSLSLKENKPLMIDSFADWCVACKELDEFTFSDADVAKVLKDYVLVKLDFTSKTPDNEKLQKDLKVIGLPTVIFLDPTGKELRRFSGFRDRVAFLKFLGSGDGWVERLVNLLKQELDKKSLLLLGLVFLLGFLTSLTPCVYPVIPIVMGYIGSRSGNKRLKGLYLSIFFVLGLALVYSLLGVIAAMAGSMVGVSFQNPVVVMVIAVIFIAMGFSLAGLFDIPVPSSISSKIQSGGQRSEIIGSFVVGGVSGIIAAPCAGPVLITLLSWISQTRNAFLGFLLTFIFSLGMGIIFLLVGTFSGLISALPKGGLWMNYIKYFFAVILIAGGIFILNSIIPGWLYLLLWGIFLISVCVFAGLFKSLDTYSLKTKIYRFLVLLLLLVGIFLFYKALELKFFTA